MGVQGAKQPSQDPREQDEKWVEIVSEMFKFEEVGEEVEGFLVARKTVPGMDAGKPDNVVYTIEKTGKPQVKFFGTPYLNDRLATVGAGEYIKIRFERLEPSTKKGMNDMKVFRVWVRHK